MAAPPQWPDPHSVAYERVQHLERLERLERIVLALVASILRSGNAVDIEALRTQVEADAPEE